MSIYIGTKKSKLFLGNKKIKKIYAGTEKVYSSGSIVIYCVDTNIAYQEEVDSEATCLSPKTFTPTKSGYTFVGWREDTTASSSVLTSKVMEDSPITLYAVFKQTITLSYNGNSSTSGSVSAQSGYKYYNNGNITNPSFTLASNGFNRTNYTFKAWALGSASGTQYSAGKSVTISTNTVCYAVWVGIAYTWVSNYVGSGATLTINGSKTYCVDLDFPTNTFKLDPNGQYDDQNLGFTAYTNTVDTRGLTYMKITVDDFYPGTSSGYFKVMSSSGATLYSNTSQISQETLTVNVSSASAVYIAVSGASWSQSEGPKAIVSAISFSN